MAQRCASGLDSNVDSNVDKDRDSQEFLAGVAPPPLPTLPTRFVKAGRQAARELGLDEPDLPRGAHTGRGRPLAGLGASGLLRSDWRPQRRAIDEHARGTWRSRRGDPQSVTDATPTRRSPARQRSRATLHAGVPVCDDHLESVARSGPTPRRRSHPSERGSDPTRQREHAPRRSTRRCETLQAAAALVTMAARNPSVHLLCGYRGCDPRLGRRSRPC